MLYNVILIQKNVMNMHAGGINMSLTSWARPHIAIHSQFTELETWMQDSNILSSF